MAFEEKFVPQVMEREEEVLGHKLGIMSFVLGGRYYARVYNVQRNAERLCCNNGAGLVKCLQPTIFASRDHCLCYPDLDRLCCNN